MRVCFSHGPKIKDRKWTSKSWAWVFFTRVQFKRCDTWDVENIYLEDFGSVQEWRAQSSHSKREHDNLCNPLDSGFLWLFEPSFFWGDDTIFFNDNIITGYQLLPVAGLPNHHGDVQRSQRLCGEQSAVAVLIQRCKRCKMVHPGGNHVGHPGCHEQLPVTTMTGPTGDGWESTHRNCDDLGMICSWFYHSNNMSQMSFQYYQPTMDEANVG